MRSWAIVTVAWRSAADLERLVDSMNRCLVGGSKPKLVVVDNEPDPAARDAARLWGGASEYLENPGNPGFGAAANRGVASAGADAVVIINPDCRLVDSSLERLADEAIRRGCIAGPRILGSDRRPQASASPVPASPALWLGALWPGRLQPGPLRARTEPWRLERSVRVGWLAGMCLAGVRQTLLEIGPFDPAIHMYGEDMDLGLRARAAGVESWFMPDVARVVHLGRGSSEQRWPQGPEPQMAAMRRAVVRRDLGRRAEARDLRIQALNLRLRRLAKRALRRDAGAEARHLDAILSVEAPPDLTAPPTAPHRTPRR